MPFDKNKIPGDLLESYLEGKCGFFIGAGLSRGAGFPDWPGLLLKMIDKAEADRVMTEEHAEDCRRLADNSSKYLVLAEELRDVLVADFKTVLEETFTDPEILPTSKHDHLVSLQKNNFIVTTNYDLLIEQAFVKRNVFQTPYKYYEASAIQRQLYQRNFFLLKAHGDAKTGADQIVLTDKDYRNLLYSEPGYQSTLQSIFTMYSVIFVGCSLDDPELKLLLSYINAAFPEGGIPHYALMTTEAAGEVERNRWRKDYNMKIISISPDNDYQDIDDFLSILIELENQ